MWPLRRRWRLLPLTAVLLLTACQAASTTSAPSATAPAPPAAPVRELRVGDRAPDFALPDQNRQEVRLSQFHGRPVQVAFYVYAFSGG
jgi:cytochrome oxidase Cu insertion factor (SCO1/SenC/PrrC family)